jgi:sRNA-binding regulator protein Hfq
LTGEVFASKATAVFRIFCSLEFHRFGGPNLMNGDMIQSSADDLRRNEPAFSLQRRARSFSAAPSFRSSSSEAEDVAAHRQAELFYLQKQIQAQTQMVIILEDGERIEGCIEWYDRGALKIRGKAKTLIYKSAIKYMYKLAEVNQ